MEEIINQAFVIGNIVFLFLVTHKIGKLEEAIDNLNKKIEEKIHEKDL